MNKLLFLLLLLIVCLGNIRTEQTKLGNIRTEQTGGNVTISNEFVRAPGDIVAGGPRGCQFQKNAVNAILHS